MTDIGRVLITDGQWRKALAATRSLGRQGIQVTVGETTRLTTSFFSKYCSQQFLYPDPVEQPDDHLEALLRELTRNEYQAIFPMEDHTVELYSKNREEIAKHTTMPIPDHEALMAAMDKAKTMEIAASLDIQCPKSFVFSDADEVEEHIDEIPLPAIIKPRRSAGSVGLRTVTAKEDIIPTYRAVSADYPMPIIQERLPPGGAGYGVGVLFNMDSEMRAAFAYKRLREYPVRGGPSTLRESIADKELVEKAKILMEKLRWRGVAMVEFKRDLRDNSIKLLEINPRFWGSLQLAISSGVDFPYLLYRVAVDGDISPVFQYETGIRCRWLLPGDILHFLSNPDRLHMEPGFFQFFDGTAYDIFSKDDPLPILGRTLAMAGYTFSPKMWKRVLRR
jgi:predicted ATP-grasp superfamily ATP-dependent carboligase